MADSYIDVGIIFSWCVNRVIFYFLFQVLISLVIALTTAITHLLLFRYLDGKPADSPQEVAPQSYISTASNILANMFGFFLRAALGVAFVQYLWRLLRVETMKVSTIELLFSIRSNPFVLLKPAALKATPLLFVLSVLIWVSQILTSFPPGAITVAATQKISNSLVSIPTFNASFVRSSDFDLQIITDMERLVDGKYFWSCCKCLFAYNINTRRSRWIFYRVSARLIKTP
jgi:hypothetical protein